MRKHIILNIALALAAVASVCSCEKEIRFNGKYDGNKVVLFASANPGAPLSARIYRTSFILDREEYKTRDSILSGATVIAEINGKQYPMVEEKGLGYITDYVPKAGDHIRVSASVKGFDTVWGETTVPTEPSYSIVESDIVVKDEEGWQQADVHFRITINDLPDENNYYSMRMYRPYSEEELEYAENIGIEYISSFENLRLYSKDALFYEFDEFETITGDHDYRVPVLFEDSGFAGKSHTFDVYTTVASYRDGQWDEETGQWIPGEIEPVTDKIRKMVFFFEIQSWSESMYRYKVSYDKADNIEGITEVFGEPVKISCNIEGGGIGCVGAVTTKTVKID